MNQGFFDERTDQSEVKARIIQEYFFAWAKVISPTAQKNGNKIGYIDLYAGPGRYKDGAASTPLLVLTHAINDPRMSQMLVSLFNDSDQNKTQTLKSEINKLPGIENLKYKPKVSCKEIDERAENYFNQTKLIPSFSFVDPFGYKGLSLGIINGVIKDWGCDCVFFFNYNRINAGISNDKVYHHMSALFGEERVDKLKKQFEEPGITPDLREALILEELAKEIKALGGKFVLPFTFKNEKGSRTTHKLIFVSKHFKGYEIMKSIMAKESSTEDQGVASFTYSPADASMPLLFSLQRPLDELSNSLVKDYAGKQLSRREIYQEHSIDTPYLQKNYTEALKKLEQDKIITARSTNGKKRRPCTYPEHVLISFPGEQDNGK